MCFELRETRKVYEGKRINVHRDLVKQPDGTEVVRELVTLADAAAIVPLTSEGGVVLISQLRYPVGDYLWEIPAGVLDGEEEPEACARRELEEETGYKPGVLTYLGRIYTSPGVCSEIIHLYLAEKLERGKANLDHGEIIKPKIIGFSEVLDMIDRGEITDAKTICAIFLAQKEMAGRS